jgi:hypothetical protein
MKKIYFANTTWNESPQLIENFIHQTPENLGVWGNITYTLNKDESDYIIVMDETTESVDPKKVIFFGREPHYIGLRKWTQESYGNYHHELGNSWLAMTWWTKIQFNNLVNMEPIKNKDLSAIDSGKRHTPYHKFRADLITSFLKKHPKEIDGYGHICNNVLPYRDKTKGLMDYRYNLVLENGKTDFYFSEKFCDPLLFLTMPIYKGCKKIDKFFPKGSYIEFDDSKGIDYAIDMIFDYSKSKYREENIELLKEARDLTLNKYNIWNTISLAVNNKKII